MKRKQPERNLQQACNTWMRYQHPERLYFAIPNGGSRNALEALNLKKEGVLPGVADCVLFENTSAGCPALWIEFKSDKGRQSIPQRYFEVRVLFRSHQYVIIRTLDEFIETVNNYLNS